MKLIRRGTADTASRWSSSPVALCSIAVTVALLARLASMILWGDTSSSAVLWEYGEQAECALRNGGDLCRFKVDGTVYPSAYMPPLISYYWLTLFKLFGVTPLARLIWLLTSLLLALGSTALVFNLTLKLWPSKWAAFAAALIFAVYPTFVFVTAMYHNTNFAAFFLLAIATCSVNIATTNRLWLNAILGGMLCGLGALTRTELLYIGPLLIGLGAMYRHDWRIFARVLACSLAVMMLFVGPWTVRNYDHFDRFIPTAQSSGYNLWKGYNPYTNGSGNLSEEHQDALQRAVRDNIIMNDRPYETRVQDAFMAQFKTDIGNASASRLTYLTVNKVLLLWVFDWTDKAVVHRVAYLVPWLLVNLLVIAGIVAAWRRRYLVSRVPAAIIGLALLLLTVSYAATTVHSRYRMHIEPFLFVFAGIGCQMAWARVVHRTPAFDRPSDGQSEVGQQRGQVAALGSPDSDVPGLSQLVQQPRLEERSD